MQSAIDIDVFKRMMEQRGLRVRESEGRINVVDGAGMTIASSVKWDMLGHVFVARHPFKELLDRRVKQ